MFRNAIVYRLKPARTLDERQQPLWMSHHELDAALARKPLCAPGSQDFDSRGWVSPAGDGSMVFASGGYWLIELGIESKILPAAVVKREAEARAEKIADGQGYKPGRKQMKDLREQIMQELLPTALVRPSRIRAFIAASAGVLVIDAPNGNKAEDLLEQLRRTLDKLPLAIVRTQRSPASAMADWLAGDTAPAGFCFEPELELRSITESNATVRYSGGELDHAEIRSHLAAGKMPTRLSLTHDDRLTFSLTDKLTLKQLDFLDVVAEQLHARLDDCSVEADRLAAELVLFGGVIVDLIEAVTESLGGEIYEEAA